MKNKVNIYIDLEQTIISNWDDGFLINTEKVRDFLKSHNAEGFHVFSFAVWNDADRLVFNTRFKSVLENALESKVLTCNTCEDFLMDDTEFTGLHFDSLTDYISIRGKVGAFMNWTAHRHAGAINILVDDVVPNAVWENQDTRSRCVFINVFDLV